MSLIAIVMFHDLFIEILSYFDLCDLSMLDIAINSKYLRLIILNAFKYLRLTGSEFCDFKCYKHYTLEWMLKREFHFINISYLPLQDENFNKIIISSRSCLKLVKLGTNHCITNNSLINLVKECKLLTRLEIIGNNFISDDFIYAISEHCKCLTYLDLAGVWKITNKSMVTLLESQAVPLEVLMLWSNFLISDKLFTSIDSQVRSLNLKQITLNDLPDISNKTLFSIVNICIRLESISLISLPLINIDGVSSILIRCSYLKVLYICGCGNVLISITELQSQRNDVEITLQYNLYESEGSDDIYQYAENYLSGYNEYLEQQQQQQQDEVETDSDSSYLHHYYELQENY